MSFYRNSPSRCSCNHRGHNRRSLQGAREGSRRRDSYGDSSFDTLGRRSGCSRCHDSSRRGYGGGMHRMHHMHDRHDD